MDYLLDIVLPVVARIALAVLPVLLMAVAIAYLPNMHKDELCKPLIFMWLSCIAYFEVRSIRRDI